MILPGKETYAQFYNGHQMTFGKNRLQYKSKFWRYHRYDRFDTYYYKGGDNLSKRVTQIANEKISQIESFFGYGIQKRLIFLCYKKLSDFKESNVGYETGSGNSNIGGVTRIIDNKLFVYFEGDTKSIERQISEGVTQILINDMLYSGNFRQKLTNSTLISLPNWFVSGLISFISEEWSFETENIVKDGFEGGKYKKINHLIGEDATYAGHSFWNFVSNTYGKDVIPNILYLTRINKNAESGFVYVLGKSTKELGIEWLAYYSELYNNFETEANLPQNNENYIKAKKKRAFQTVKISPDNKYIAYVSNASGKYRISIYDKSTKKKKVIRKKGHSLEQITDYSYPVIAWHPSSKMLVYVTENKGNLTMNKYMLEDKKLVQNNIMYFDKIISMDFSHDGYKIVVSGVKDGQSDIYVYNLTAANFEQITNDIADDLNPVFAEKSTKILFSSNRKNKSLSDTAKGNKTFDIFSYNYLKKEKELIKITDTPFENETQPLAYKKNIFIALTDKNGIINKQIIKHDSTISYVDTTVHYRYYTSSKLITEYSRNVNLHHFNKQSNNFADVIYNNKRYHIYTGVLDENNVVSSNKTKFRRSFSQDLIYNDSLRTLYINARKRREAEIDSLRQNPPKNLVHPDSMSININNYVFETEKNLKYYEINPIQGDTLVNDSTKKEILLPTFFYLTNFYTNYVVQQVDFGFLNNSYQAFTGSAYYFNPGMNVFTKIGIYDLFEDYRISAGFRLGTNLDSYEYLFSFENLKKRIDKQFLYHRQTFTESYVDSYGYPFSGKIFTNEFMYIWKYPFNQVASTKATLSIRHDKGVILSEDYPTLMTEDDSQFFAGAKMEYIFDNTNSPGLNLYSGTRFKLFGEFYQEVDKEYTNLFVLGADFRFYQKLHRNIIFASRTAASASLGKSKLIYYLGGVDNWYVFSPDKMQFDNSININPNENYIYQAVATNMRGFIQNARNGTNFFVVNNEIRIPIIKYLANRPLNSDFLNSFQIVGFADAGSAWSGLTPYDESNAYNTETVQNGPITVIIDKNRWPVVFGYGLGVRSRLFGYFFRLDWAWGVDSDVVLPRVFYFSLNLDF